MVRGVLEGAGEVMAAGVAVNKENDRNESLAVRWQLLLRDHCRAARIMPMVVIGIPKGWRFMQKDHERRGSHPVFFLPGEVVIRVGGRLKRIIPL